jgi:hypothetical protein
MSSSCNCHTVPNQVCDICQDRGLKVIQTTKSQEIVRKKVGKPPISLIPREAIVQEAQALAFGATKHGVHAYRNGVKYSLLIDAAIRHILAFADGEDMDSEAKTNHIANARANLGMLLYMFENHKEMDDRWVTDPEVKAKRKDD